MKGGTRKPVLYDQLLQSFGIRQGEQKKKKKRKKKRKKNRNGLRKKVLNNNLENHISLKSIEASELRYTVDEKPNEDPFARGAFKEFSMKYQRKQYSENPPLHDRSQLGDDKNGNVKVSCVNFVKSRQDFWFTYFNKPRGLQELMQMGDKLSRFQFHVVQIPDFSPQKFTVSKNFTIPENEFEMMKKITDLHLQHDLAKKWISYISPEIDSGDVYNYFGFRDLDQKLLFNILNGYHDLLMMCRNQYDETIVRETYVLHVLNHLLKTKRYQWNNDEKIQIRGAGYNVKDSGFHRPRVLVIVPFKFDAFEFVNNMIELLPEVVSTVNRNEQFQFAFGTEYLKKKKQKSLWKRIMFAGNIEDDYSFGIVLETNNIRLLEKEEDSDIIITTPLGLRKKSEEEMIDLFSSIEMLIMDRLEVIDLFQNWENLTKLFKSVNKYPKDLEISSRTRDYFNHGFSSNFRQTLIFSEYNTIDIENLFFRCNNFRDKFKIGAEYQGLFTSEQTNRVFPPQIMKKITSKIDEMEEMRFNFFCEVMFPHYIAKSDNVMMVVSTHLEYVRVRNFFKRKGIDLIYISELEKNYASLLKRKGSYGKVQFILYSEKHYLTHDVKFHYFNADQLMFYNLPKTTHLYNSLARYMSDVHEENNKARITCMYTVFDFLKLERIFGTSQAKELVKSGNDTMLLKY